jgi:hypothetical protein
MGCSGRWRLRRPLSPPRVFRRYQITTEVMSQASVAQIITSGVEASGFPATDCSVQAVLLFFLFLVFFN